MPKVHTTFQGQTTVHNLEDKPGGFTVLVHGQGIKIDVPTFVEINCRTTLRCMEDMNQNQWEWISTGDIFRTLWKEAFDFTHSGNGVPELPPTQLSDLLSSDPGVIHVAGMIVQGCEAGFEGKSAFFRNPETLLHPATERTIMSMFHEMLKLFGGRGTVTKVEKEPEQLEKLPEKKGKKGKKKGDVINIATPEQLAEEEAVFAQERANKDLEQTKSWLSKHALDAKIAALQPEVLEDESDPVVYTASQLLEEIDKQSDIGRQIVELFAAKRDGR